MIRERVGVERSVCFCMPLLACFACLFCLINERWTNQTANTQPAFSSIPENFPFWDFQDSSVCRDCRVSNEAKKKKKKEFHSKKQKEPKPNMAEQQQPVLHYFAGRGLANPLRFVLAFAGISWREVCMHPI